MFRLYIFKLFNRELYSSKIIINIMRGVTGIRAAINIIIYTTSVGDKISAVLAGIVYNIAAFAAGVNNKIPIALAGLIYNIAACAAGVNNKTPAILAGIAYNTTAYAAGINNKTPAALAGIINNTAACAAGANNKISAVLANIAYNTLGVIMAGNGPNYKFIYVCPDKTDVWLSIIVYLHLLVYNLLYSFVGGLDLLNLINSIAYGLAPDSLVLGLINSRSNTLLFLLFWRIFAISINYNALYIGSNQNILLNIIFEL